MLREGEDYGILSGEQSGKCVSPPYTSPTQGKVGRISLPNRRSAPEPNLFVSKINGVDIRSGRYLRQLSMAGVERAPAASMFILTIS